MFDDGHHTLPLEEPDAINDAVTRFLERVAQRSLQL
jgi:pimeloyl-ACP methyl ester carboxylesterase